MKNLIFLLLFFLPILSYGQIERDVTATITFGAMSTVNDSTFQGDITINDQTNTYNGNDLATGHLVVSSSGRLYRIDAINTPGLFVVNVDLVDIQGSPFVSPSGTANLSTPTTNFGFILFTPDNTNGISQQSKSIIESHNWLVIDSLLQALGGGLPAMNDLTDVDSPSPTNGQILKFNSGSGNWELDMDNVGAGGGMTTGDSTWVTDQISDSLGTVETIFAGGTFDAAQTLTLFENATGSWSSRFISPSNSGHFGLYSDTTDNDFLGLRWVTARGTFDIGEDASELRIFSGSDLRFKLPDSGDRVYLESTLDTDNTNTQALTVDPVTFELELVDLATDTFQDNTFRLQSNTNPTYLLRFDLDSLTKSSLVNLPDKDGTMAMVSDIAAATSTTFVDSVGEIVLNTYSLGDAIITKGFYAPGDGSIATYVVQANPVTGYTTDGVAVIAVGSNFAVLQAPNGVDIRWGGGLANDNTTDNAAFTTAATYAKVLGVPVLLNGGVYDVTGELVLGTDLVSIDKSTLKLLPSSDTYILAVYDVDTVAIAGVIFDGNLANQDTVTYTSNYTSLRSESAIQAFRGVVDLRVDNCDFINLKCGGIAIESASTAAVQSAHPGIEVTFPGADKTLSLFSITNSNFVDLGGQAVAAYPRDFGVDTTDAPHLSYSAYLVARGNRHINNGKINENLGAIIPSQVNGDTYALSGFESVRLEDNYFEGSGRYELKASYTKNFLIQGNEIVTPLWGGFQFVTDRLYTEAYKNNNIVIRDNTMRVGPIRNGQTTFPMFAQPRGSATTGSNPRAMWERLVIDNNTISYDTAWIRQWQFIGSDVIEIVSNPKFRDVYITNNTAENFPRAFVGISDAYEDSEKMNSFNIIGNTAKSERYDDPDNQSRFIKSQGGGDTATWKEFNVLDNTVINLGYIAEIDALVGSNIDISGNDFLTRDNNRQGLRFAGIITNTFAYDTVTIIGNHLRDGIIFNNVETHSDVFRFANNTWRDTTGFESTYNSLGVTTETVRRFSMFEHWEQTDEDGLKYTQLGNGVEDGISIEYGGGEFKAYVNTLNTYYLEGVNAGDSYLNLNFEGVGIPTYLGASNAALTFPHGGGTSIDVIEIGDGARRSVIDHTTAFNNETTLTFGYESTAGNGDILTLNGYISEGLIDFDQYGQGEHIFDSLAITRSNYIAGFGTTGTVFEATLGEMYFDNPFGGDDTLDSFADSTFANAGGGGGGGINTLNTLTNSIQSFATGTTGTDFNISSGAGVHTFSIPDASDTNRGVITIGAQDIAGQKTFLADLEFDAHLIDVNGSTGSTNNVLTRGASGPDWGAPGLLLVTNPLGGTNSLQASLDSLDANLGGTPLADAFFNSSSGETIDVVVTSNGTTISLTIEEDGGGDIDFNFSDGVYTFDATPAASVNLTAGTDASPTLNYIFVLQSNKTLTANTTGWPATEHAPIATVLAQSAASAQADGLMKVHAWTDHISKTNNQGHLADLNYWIRQQPATWTSGVQYTVQPSEGTGLSNIWVTTTSGTVLQLHQHTMPAFSDTTAFDYFVPNDFTTPNLKLNDLTDLTDDALGNSLGSNFFTIVLWGSVSEDTGDSHLFINLPNGTYTTLSAASSDGDKYTVYDIDMDYQGTGFLIAEILLDRNAGGSNFDVERVIDLRGKFPGATAGGSLAAAVEFQDDQFTIFDNLDPTKEIMFELSSITTGNTRTLTAPDEDGTIALLTDIIPDTNGIFDINNDGGTVPGSFDFALTDSLLITTTHEGTDQYMMTLRSEPGFAGESGGISYRVDEDASSLFGLQDIFSYYWQGDKLARWYHVTGTPDVVAFETFLDQQLSIISNGVLQLDGEQSVVIGSASTDSVTIIAPLPYIATDSVVTRTPSGRLSMLAITDISGSGDVSKVGTPVNNQIGVWTGDGTIEGDAGLTFGGGLLTTTAEILSNNVTVTDDAPTMIFKDTGTSWSANQQTAFDITDQVIFSQGPFSGTDGGYIVEGFNKSTSPNARGIVFRSYLENEPTTFGAITMDMYKHDGAGSKTVLGATSKLFMITNNGAADLTLYGDGDLDITGNYTGGGGLLTVTNPLGGTNTLQATLDSLDANSGGGGSGHVIADDAVGVTARDTLNFTGPLVATDATTRTDISFDIDQLTSETGGGHATQDEFVVSDNGTEVRMTILDALSFGTKTQTEATTTIDFENAMTGVVYVDLNLTATLTYTSLTNGVSGMGYIIHIIDVNGSNTTITWPSNVYLEDNTLASAQVYTQDQAIPIYYNSSNSRFYIAPAK